MTATDTAAPRRPGLGKPLLIGLVLAALAGGGAFWATAHGPLGRLLDGTAAQGPGDAGAAGQDAAEVAFVQLESLTVPLGGGRMLLFGATLEAAPGAEAALAHMTPRILDALNGFLRVVSIEEVEDPRAMLRLRAQMLRRVQTVAGPDLVSDLLITHFVVN